MVDTKDYEKFEQPFDYSNIKKEHLEAVKEVLRLLKEELKTSELTLDYIKLKFNINEIPEINIKDTKFLKAAEKAGIYVPIVGHIVEGSGLEAKKYPVIGLSEDIRKLEKLFD